MPKKAERLGQRAAAIMGYKHTHPTDTALYGGLSDYAGYVLGIPSLTLEVGKGKNPLPDCQLESIFPSLSTLLFKLPTML